MCLYMCVITGVYEFDLIICQLQEQFYGREIIVADRELVEQGAEVFLEEAKEKDIALLVVGDPFGATTHTDILLRAQELGVKFEIVHNASILNAVGCCGLQVNFINLLFGF